MKGTVAIAKEHEASARIEARRVERGRREVLREEQVLMAVAVEVGHDNPEGRRKLCLVRQRVCFEMISAIEEQLMVERRGAHAHGGAAGISEHLTHSGMGERSEGGEACERSGNCQAQASERLLRHF